jgi:hypothetical protein
MIRFRVESRDVPASEAARLLGVDLTPFDTALPSLLARGFPGPDPTTGNFDLKAIENWMDRRSGLQGVSSQAAKDAATVVASRLAKKIHAQKT